MYIFWDNSNIHISGLTQVMPNIEPQASRELYRTHFANLFKLIKKDRNVDCAYLSGSVPPPNDQLWNYLTCLNIKLQLLEKTADGKEQESVDMSLQTMMLRTAIDTPPSIMAIVTGDGAGKQLGEGFLSDIQRIKERLGWQIELYAWESSCNNRLKQYAKENGIFTRLEDYYENITFIQQDRKGDDPYYRIVKPLSL